MVSSLRSIFKFFILKSFKRICGGKRNGTKRKMTNPANHVRVINSKDSNNITCQSIIRCKNSIFIRRTARDQPWSLHVSITEVSNRILSVVRFCTPFLETCTISAADNILGAACADGYLP